MGAMDDYLNEEKAPAQAAPQGKSAMDAYLDDEPQAASPEKPSMAVAAMNTLAPPVQALERRAGNAMLGGYVPQLAGLVRKYMPDPNADTNKDLEAQGFKISEPQFNDYLAGRDETAAMLKRDKEEHPYASFAGDLAGSVAIGGPLMKGINKAAPVLGKMGAYAAGPGANLMGKIGALGVRSAGAGATGAAIMGASNPGDVEGEIDPIQLGQRGKNAAVGFATGMALNPLVEGTVAGFGAAKDKLNSYAEEKAAKAIGLDKAAYKKILKEKGPEAVRRMGRTALDEELVTPLSTPAKVAERAGEAQERVGEEIGELIEGADRAGAAPINGDDVALEMMQSPELAKARLVPGNEANVSAIDQMLETLAKNGQMSLKQTQELRRAIDKQINWAKATPDMRGKQEALYDIRDTLRGKISDGVDSVAPQMGGQAGDLASKNKLYSTISDIEKYATNRAAGNAANRSVGLTDTISGGAGATIGGLAGAQAGPHGMEIGATVGGGIGAGINKLGRTYGPSLQATGANRLAKIASAFPKLGALIQANPQAAPLLLNALGSPKDIGSKAPQLDPQMMKTLTQNPGLIDTLDDENLKAQLRKAIGANREPSEAEKAPDQTQIIDKEDAKAHFLER
jgi:hypothetical protein